MSYLYVRWNSFGWLLARRRFVVRARSVFAGHSLHCGLSAPPTASQSFVPEWPAKIIRRVLSERVALGISGGGALCITSELFPTRELCERYANPIL